MGIVSLVVKLRRLTDRCIMLKCYVRLNLFFNIAGNSWLNVGFLLLLLLSLLSRQGL